MPLQKPEDFGTADNGFRINDYCRYCYQGGAFTEPQIDMTGMITKCVDIMAQQGIMSEVEARAVMTEVIPKLKRWQPA